MRRDRLAAVLRLRELTERKRLAERAAALRAVEEAEAAHAAARSARADHTVAPGVALVPVALYAHRLGGLALGDQVRSRQDGHRVAVVHEERAARQLVEAAIARRSVERLAERRADTAARAQAKQDARRDDEVALQAWRRSS